MRYRVKLKSTVTAWVEVEVPTEGFDEQGAREWAADDAVEGGDEQFHQRVNEGRCEYGPIELAYEELDESVEVIS